MDELITINNKPNTDLEKFQALRIEALEREIEKLKKLNQQAKEIFNAMLIDVADAEIINP